MIIICPYCKKKADRGTGYVNRALKLNVPIYCSRVCSGLARRCNKTKEEKKLEKKEYDKKFRKLNAERIKKSKHEAFKKDYKNNPEKYKRIRQKRKEEHNEYCRRPEYRLKKKSYDHAYKLKLKYGEFWEAASTLLKLENKLDSKQIKYDLGIINKTQKRKEKWKQLQKNN